MTAGDGTRPPAAGQVRDLGTAAGEIATSAFKLRADAIAAGDDTLSEALGVYARQAQDLSASFHDLAQLMDL